MTETVEQSPGASWGPSLVWGGAFLAGSFGIPLAGRALHWPTNVSLAGMGAAMLLLIPFVRAMERRMRASGCVSGAMLRYNRRALVWTFSYVVALVAAISIARHLSPTGPLLWIVAIMPALPVLLLLWAMGRYLIEESDEYLRARMIQAALIATGVLLGVATFWGFLESFGLVRHAEGWWAVPIWAVGLGVGQGVLRARS